MSDYKTKLMAQFYAECQQKGYTDMHDSTQSLKAKVIATDLGLDYGNIVYFYEKARDCYEHACIEEAEAEKRRAREAVNGKLLVTVSGSDDEIEVFIRPDRTVYCKLNGGSKIEGFPLVKARNYESILTKYNPSELVYTGATVGGITTGGFHVTEDSYSFSSKKTDKGEIIITLHSQEINVNEIVFSDFTKKLFKRDDDYCRLVDKDNRISCYVDSEKTKNYFHYGEMQSSSGNHAMAVNMASLAIEETKLPYYSCVRIANLVDRVVRGQFPPSDEELYNTAVERSASNRLSDVEYAINAFEKLKGFKDSRERAKALEPKHQELIQKKKEEAVIEKEASKFAVKLFFFPARCFITIVLAAMAHYFLVDQEYKITPFFMFAAAIVSAPGIEKLIFKKEYRFKQKILHIGIVIALFFIGSILDAMFSA